MPDGFVTILLVLLVVVIIWLVVKFIFKLTMQIFSCGCLLILAIAALLFFTGFLEISFSF